MNQFMKKAYEEVFLRCFLTTRMECGDGKTFGCL